MTVCLPYPFPRKPGAAPHQVPSLALLFPAHTMPRSMGLRLGAGRWGFTGSWVIVHRVVIESLTVNRIYAVKDQSNSV